MQAVAGDRLIRCPADSKCNFNLVLPPPAISACHGLMSSIQATVGPLSHWSSAGILASHWLNARPVSGSWINILIVVSGNSNDQPKSIANTLESTTDGLVLDRND